MKHLYLFRLLIIGYILFTGCSPKETFYFSKSTDSFGYYQKVQKEANLPNSLIIHNKLTDQERLSNKDSPDFSVTTATATNPKLLPLPKQTYTRGFNASIPAKKVEMHLYPPVVKIKARQNQAIKKYSDDPVANKKVQGEALVSFIFSITALILFFAGSWPLAVLFGIIGSILGIVGLNKIKRNPDKYSGKGFAWIGIILGLIFALFIIGFLLSFGA